MTTFRNLDIVDKEKAIMVATNAIVDLKKGIWFSNLFLVILLGATVFYDIASGIITTFPGINIFWAILNIYGGGIFLALLLIVMLMITTYFYYYEYTEKSKISHVPIRIFNTPSGINLSNGMMINEMLYL